jgi:signal transduction histidine kinase
MTSMSREIEGKLSAQVSETGMRRPGASRASVQTIRGEFVLFAVCLALPLVGLIGYGLYDRARDEFADAEVLARRLAESNADRVAEYVQGLRVTLEAVARRPLVRAMDAERCDPRLADLVDLYPRAGSFIVVDRDGVILCSSRPLPRGRVVRIVDDELLREMLADPRFRVSKPVVSRVTGRWIVSAVQPVLGDSGALAGTVAVATELEQWRPFLPPEGLPAGAVITVVTTDGTIIARSADAERWISRKIWDERIIQRVVELGEGVIRAKGPDNVNHIFGVKPVSGLSWFVLAGLPEESVFAPARQRLVLTAAVLTLVLSLVLALSWYFVARFSRPIQAIAAAVRARSEMRTGAKLPLGGPREIAQVAAAFNRMVEAEERSAREREHARRILQENEQRFRDLNELSSDFFWETDAQHRFTQLVHGKRFRPIFAQGADIGKARWEMPSVAPDAAGWRAYREMVDAHREFRDFRFVRRDLDGRLRHFEVSGKPLYEEGRFIGYRGAGVEVTDRVVAEERLAQLNRELEDRVHERTAALEALNKELESFTYSVSHDLRSPLRAVDGYARMLEEDYRERLDAEGQRLLQVVREASSRMGRLIDDLLAFSKLGRQEAVRRRVGMSALVAEVIAESRGDSSAAIEAAPLPATEADPAMMKQVWINLIGNALKYSGRRQGARIEIGGREERAENVYWVRDNGVGFDMRYADKLFGVFQRLHRQEDFPGTGVGLAIVQRVITRHGGRVWAEGRPGEGACFYFSLPRET